MLEDQKLNKDYVMNVRNTMKDKLIFRINCFVIADACDKSIQTSGNNW